MQLNLLRVEQSSKGETRYWGPKSSYTSDKERTIQVIPSKHIL